MSKECKHNKDFIRRIQKEGKVIEFDKNSKLVFISDVHRGDGGYADSLRQNENIYKAALGFYYKNDYTLIELGDGDELWKNKSCLDIAYNYKEIFRILTKFYEDNRLYLIYGNHDIVKSNSKFIKQQEKIFNNVSYNFGLEMLMLYSNIEFYEGIILRYIPLNKDILVFHGHQVDFMNCEMWKLSRFLVRYIWRALEGIAGFKEPISPANNYDKGSKIDDILDKLAKSERKMIICGHTHNDRLPEVGKGLYFNDGCCIFPSAISCIEILNGYISLIKWKIEVDKSNVLYIKKSIIGGPKNIEQYLKYTP